MAKPKISPKKYEASVVAARKAGGNKVQSHLEARLRAAVKRQTKRVKKPPAR
jgi:hypothetical protein